MFEVAMNSGQFMNTLEAIGFQPLLGCENDHNYCYSWGTRDDGIYVSIGKQNERGVFSFWIMKQNGRASMPSDLFDFRKDLGKIVSAIAEIVNSPARRPHLPIADMARGYR